MENPIERVRTLCMELPGASEKISWSEPTWRHKKVFAMYAAAENHHGGGRNAVWLAAAPGMQEMLLEVRPDAFFKPPYVGVKGWVGIYLDAVDNDELGLHIRNAYVIDAPPKLLARLNEEGS